MSLTPDDISRFETADRHVSELVGHKAALHSDVDKLTTRLAELEDFLGRESEVRSELDRLSQAYFENVAAVLQDNLTLALRDVLQQPLQVKAEADTLRNVTVLKLSILRDADPDKSESIMEGQGGSVANILSTGLRLLALKTLDPQTHRPFLVLDEQDCWIQPAILPRFVQVIRESADQLGYQILMISHHDERVFLDSADRVIRLDPQSDGSVKTTTTLDRRLQNDFVSDPE